MKRRGLGIGGLTLVLAIAQASCAREEMPPGTGPDFEPPAVVEMFPAHGSAVPDLEEDAYVRFDEPLGDPRSVARVVETSPSWLYEINAGRRNVRIRPRDGWRPGVVYMFRIPPGIRDLVRNQTREPIEFLFSTGAQISGTRTSGKVWDREAVRPVRDAAVQVIGLDSVPYAAVTDTGGSFVLPSLPVGDYWAYAFRDQNRNRVLDRDFEPHDSGRVGLAETTSAVRLEFWLTAPDSTAPVLGSVEAADSLTLRLDFDDLLEPEAALDSATVNVAMSSTGEEWPIADFVVGALSTVDSIASPAAELDSTQANAEAGADSIAPVPGQEGAVSPGEQPGGRPIAAERARPQRFVSVRLARALVEGSYDVSARGFQNLRQLAGGGDTTLVYVAPPGIPEEEAGEEGMDRVEERVEPTEEATEGDSVP